MGSGSGLSKVLGSKAQNGDSVVGGRAGCPGQVAV